MQLGAPSRINSAALTKTAARIKELESAAPSEAIHMNSFFVSSDISAYGVCPCCPFPSLRNICQPCTAQDGSCNAGSECCNGLDCIE